MTEPRTRAGRLLLGKNTSSDTATNEWLLNDILAIEREAAALDVDWLAEALDVLSDDGLEYELMAPEEREERFEAAERLAAEYAHLAAPSSKKVTG